MPCPMVPTPINILLWEIKFHPLGTLEVQSQLYVYSKYVILLCIILIGGGNCTITMITLY